MRAAGRRGARPARPVGPVRYGPFARLADWYHGRRDGRMALPDPERTARSTPTRDYLAERTRDAYEHEHLWYERDRARAAQELAAVAAELDRAGERLERARAHARELAAGTNTQHTAERRGGEWRTDPRIVRDRRRTEYTRRVRRAEAAATAAEGERDAVADRLVRIQEDIARRSMVATARVTRLREHCAQRLSVYRRALLRHHPRPGWTSLAIDAAPPPLPDWLSATPSATTQSTAAQLTGPAPIAAASARRNLGEARTAGELLDLQGDGMVFGSSVGTPGLLTDPAVPGRFFVLTWNGANGYRLEVLEPSDDGPYVDGRPVGAAVLAPGATVGLVGSRLRLLPDGQVERITDDGRLVVGDLTQVSRGRNRLTRLSFAQAGGTVTAIIGPSGAGKTTMFEAILGELGTEADGSIVFDGRPVLGRTEEIRHLIGYVPQTEDLHMSLTVAQVLRFTDQLRRHTAHGRARSAARIAEVCKQLHLGHRMKWRIRELSGGERKRLSIALEVVKRPRLLMLDEPTSGLDTGLDHEVMEILRSIAETGCTVALTTHAVEHLEEADDLLVIAREGRAVYYGPPGEALGALGFDEGGYTGLMTWLRDGDLGPAAAEYLQTPGAKSARDEAASVTSEHDDGSEAATPPGGASEVSEVSETSETSGPSGKGQPSGKPRPSRPHRTRAIRGSISSELNVLIRRQLALLAARAATDEDAKLGTRLRAAVQPFAPLLLAVAGALLAAEASGARGLRPLPGSGSPTAALSFLVTVCALTGQALTYSDVVSEVGVIRRECRTGVRPGCVIVAKWCVYSCVAVVQAAAVTAVFVGLRHAPAFSVVFGGGADLFIGLSAMGVSAVSLGLLISARAARLEQAVGFATGAAIVQVALNGVTINLSGPLRWLSYLVPSRWGMGALASSTNLPAITPHPAAGAVSQVSTALGGDALWQHGLDRWLLVRNRRDFAPEPCALRHSSIQPRPRILIQCRISHAALRRILMFECATPPSAATMDCSSDHALRGCHLRLTVAQRRPRSQDRRVTHAGWHRIRTRKPTAAGFRRSAGLVLTRSRPVESKADSGLHEI
jgi:ABC-type multidrug transport system ATPase subunit